MGESVWSMDLKCGTEKTVIPIKVPGTFLHFKLININCFIFLLYPSVRESENVFM